MASEKNIMNRCLLALGKLQHLRFWRNNTGSAWTGNKIIRLTPGATVRAGQGDVLIRDARPIRFGLAGSADIIGLQAIRITPDMTGQTVGQFIAVEVKKPGSGRQSDQQKKFQAMVEGFGGRYALATSPEEAVAALTGGKTDAQD